MLNEKSKENSSQKNKYFKKIYIISFKLKTHNRTECRSYSETRGVTTFLVFFQAQTLQD